MKIKISGLENDTYVDNFDGDFKEIGLEDPFFGKYKTMVVLEKFDAQIILEVSSDINSRMSCDRCGTEFNKKIESQYKMVYLLRNVENCIEELDFNYLTTNTNEIDIKNDVRDYFLLAIPMKKLCKHDCKGLCYKCGSNLNNGECDCNYDEIDDRWKALLDLKKKLNTN
ncbi:MAG: DUF177 domain-containing protein [Ignavibacteria bacterium]|nr:DUF177 domain-containing protein [Ignavibacteria bacterium]